VYEVVGCCSL